MHAVLEVVELCSSELGLRKKVSVAAGDQDKLPESYKRPTQREKTRLATKCDHLSVCVCVFGAETPDFS